MGPTRRDEFKRAIDELAGRPPKFEVGDRVVFRLHRMSLDRGITALDQPARVIEVRNRSVGVEYHDPLKEGLQPQRLMLPISRVWKAA